MDIELPRDWPSVSREEFYETMGPCGYRREAFVRAIRYRDAHTGCVLGYIVEDGTYLLHPEIRSLNH